MNLLLDTNVLIDYLGRKDPFFTDAQRIIAAGYFGDVKLWAPAQSFNDAFYVLNRYIGAERVQDAFVKVLELVTPVAPATQDVARAASLQWEDYEDCLVALAAENVRASWIVTRDEHGFARSMVPALSPRAWLQMMDEERGVAYEAVEL